MIIHRIRSDHPAFPYGLKSVFRPPTEIYMRGPLPEGPAMAVVGTRRMSPYGKAAVRLLVPEIVRCGMAVVSGLALGIDGEAHRAALDAGGRTVAVIGSGIDDDSIYPREHLGLAKRILESGGAVVSEYPPGAPSLPHHFPARNRIIAGLSRAVLVIEAPRKSGARITARLALDAGRDVWAVPGPINHPNSWGPNDLIKNGATPICEPEDICHALGLESSGVSCQVSGAQPHPVLAALSSGPLTADQISRATGIPPASLAAAMTELELEGRIADFGGGLYGLYT
jgi:DNA processing protein